MMDPRWTAPIYQKETGQDYLGLRLVQGRMVDFLLPGIITITPRARYYAFYCWLMVEYAEAHPTGWSFNRFIKRREQIFGLANVAYDSSVTGLSGFQKFLGHWQAHQNADIVPLTVSNYLQASRGGFAAYAGVVGTLGLVKEHENQEGWEVTQKGQGLATAFTTAITDTQYCQRRRYYDEADGIETAVLQEYGAHCSLNRLAVSPDQMPTLECLLAIEAPFGPAPGLENGNRLGNLRGTLGLLLDMVDQTGTPPSATQFRHHMAHVAYADFDTYQPIEKLRPLAAQWQMYQWRDIYTYGLYALWTYFLYWLEGRDRGSFADFMDHVTAVLTPETVSKALAISYPGIDGELSGASLQQHLTELMDASGIPDGSWQVRCDALAALGQTPLNPQLIFEHLSATKLDEPEAYLAYSWLLMVAVYLRLLTVPEEMFPWYWVKEGGVDQRSLALFVAGMSQRHAGGTTVRDTWHWLFRDYVIAQHTLASLDKWRQRKANTFHFLYEDGWFTYLRDGRADLSASRIRQAIDMLHDLGLYTVNDDENTADLTKLGRQTLQRILEAADE